MTDIELITVSAVFAAEKHRNQRRDELGDPYINHPLRVGMMAAKLNMPATFIAACHLHDVIEDTDTPIGVLRTLFPEQTVELVSAVSKWWNSSLPHAIAAANKVAYYKIIAQTPDAPILKLLDRTDNLRDFHKMALMGGKQHVRAARYFEKTTEEFEGLLNQVDPMVIPPSVMTDFEAALKLLESAVS